MNHPLILALAGAALIMICSSVILSALASRGLRREEDSPDPSDDLPQPDAQYSAARRLMRETMNATPKNPDGTAVAAVYDRRPEPK